MVEEEEEEAGEGELADTKGVVARTTEGSSTYSRMMYSESVDLTNP